MVQSLPSLHRNDKTVGLWRYNLLSLPFSSSVLACLGILKKISFILFCILPDVEIFYFILEVGTDPNRVNNKRKNKTDFLFLKEDFSFEVFSLFSLLGRLRLHLQVLNITTLQILNVFLFVGRWEGECSHVWRDNGEEPPPLPRFFVNSSSSRPSSCHHTQRLK